MKIMGRDKIARINFKEVFDGHYGASDFIAMTKNFQAIFLEDIEQIQMKDSNLSRRFILFVNIHSILFRNGQFFQELGHAIQSFLTFKQIDECYNHKVKLYATSEKELDELFKMDGATNSEEMFMIHRCISRLKEMQSRKYMQELHQINPSAV